MRLLLHSNGPNVPTGYGVQTALLADRLSAAGHEVAISVYYGHQTGLGEWHGMPLLPCSGEAYGNDLLPNHALRWFGGDPLNGWIIPIMDVFGLVNPSLGDFNVAAWTPIDHYPAPKAVTEFFARTNAEPVAMSHFGEDLLKRAGLDPMYAPLMVDTNIYKPVPDAKSVVGIDDDRFVVMMNGMNKGAYHHRKGYPEAFFAFAEFAKNHSDVLLYVHAEQFGQHAQGINLVDLAMARGVGEHQLKFADQYAYVCGFITPEHLAATYSAADVLLAPSRGEGFCIPLIEAQACGTPVIVTDFSAQPELVGAGWKVSGEPEWEAALASDYIKASIPAIVNALEEAYEQRDDPVNRECAIQKAAEYDADYAFEKHWVPILRELDGPAPVVRPGKAKFGGVAVVVPVLNRPGNVGPLVESFQAHSDASEATVYFVCDEDDTAEIEAVEKAGAAWLPATRGSSFAQKVNAGFEQTSEPWLFVCGDDVRFTDGWLKAAEKHSRVFDVIGTNDTAEEGKGNPRVAAGSHADHFFIRRGYVDEHGGCLTGLVCHEGYGHFYSDVETVELAKARRTFTPCLESVVEHLHPDMGLAPIDDTYVKGWSQRTEDEKEWRKRAPLVAMQREGRGKVRAA